MTNPAVAVYVRLSQDRDGTKTSTKRQEADCRAVAKARGWKVAKVYTDNGVSAFNGSAATGTPRAVMRHMSMRVATRPTLMWLEPSRNGS